MPLKFLSVAITSANNYAILCYQVYYSNGNHTQAKQVPNNTNFTGTYTLDNLTPYTEYSVYVTAVRLIPADTGRALEGMKSEIITRRTLAGGKY